MEKAFSAGYDVHAARKKKGYERGLFSLCVKERSRETPFAAVKAASAN